MVGVVGLGLLGRGICAALLSRGIAVRAVGVSDDEVLAARQSIVEALVEIGEHGMLHPAGVVESQRAFVGGTSFSLLGDCDFVIESVTEDLSVKDNVLRDIERVVLPETPIATNTSAIPIKWLQSKRLRPDRVLGMHWAEPAYATRFQELIRGEATSDAAFESAVALAERCGKEVCVVRADMPGFIANRLGYAVIREAIHLLELGVADAETIDRAFRNSIGLWAGFCGPLRWIDISGGPRLYAKAMKSVLPTLSNAGQPAETLERAAAEGESLYHTSEAEQEGWGERYRQHAWRGYHAVDGDSLMETS